jgi:hypothetical protein
VRQFDRADAVRNVLANMLTVLPDGGGLSFFGFYAGDPTRCRLVNGGAYRWRDMGAGLNRYVDLRVIVLRVPL